VLYFDVLIEYSVENLISIYADGPELIMDGFGVITGCRESGVKINIAEIGMSASNRYDN
jgi:hypothetical protein